MVFSIITKLNELWDNYGFTMLLILSLFIILFYWFFWGRHRETGTYSKHYYLPGDNVPGAGMPLYHNYQPAPNNRSLQHSYRPPRPKKKRGPPKNSKGEAACRQYLERRYNRPFPNVRPKFMFNSVTGENLELDMFNRDLMIAVEYNGRQHYEYTPFMHGKTKDKFYAQKYRDKMKREICQKLGICLIEVPYTVPTSEIPAYLEEELRKKGK